MSDLCPVLAEEVGVIITEENANSLALSTYERSEGTTVQISCHYSELYELQGSSAVTCVGGQWEPDPPTCVVKDSSSSGDNTTPTTTSTGSDSDSDDYTTVLILVSVACAVVLVLVLIALLYRFRCCSRSKHRYKNKTSSNGSSTESLFSSQTLPRPVITKRSSLYGFYNFGMSGSKPEGLDTEPLAAPPSLWSVPPSHRQLHPTPHYQHENPPSSPAPLALTHVHSAIEASQNPAPSAISHSPMSINATWSGKSSSKLEWTYLSVDRLLRDIEASRRNNPHHSWRDFASLKSGQENGRKYRAL